MVSKSKSFQSHQSWKDAWEGLLVKDWNLKQSDPFKINQTKLVLLDELQDVEQRSYLQLKQSFFMLAYSFSEILLLCLALYDGRFLGGFWLKTSQNFCLHHRLSNLLITTCEIPQGVWVWWSCCFVKLLNLYIGYHWLFLIAAVPCIIKSLVVLFVKRSVFIDFYIFI